MKIMSIHAHMDDFEFCGSGLFSLWSKQPNANLQSKVVVCSNGESGHHLYTKKECGEVRRAEQRESAKLGGFSLEFLTMPDGKYPREGSLIVDRPFMAALWKSIRAFEPDYIFCPPIPSDTVSGIHIDHVAVADAIRKVAYMINVPHCYLEEYPELDVPAKFIKVPIIINFSDYYMGIGNQLDFAVDITEHIEQKAKLAFCHRSQIQEWLPWVNGANPASIPKNFDEYFEQFKENQNRNAKRFGVKEIHKFYEFYLVTAWGAKPSWDKVKAEVPGINVAILGEERIIKKMSSWHINE